MDRELPSWQLKSNPTQPPQLDAVGTTTAVFMEKWVLVGQLRMHSGAPSQATKLYPSRERRATPDQLSVDVPARRPLM